MEIKLQNWSVGLINLKIAFQILSVEKVNVKKVTETVPTVTLQATLYHLSLNVNRYVMSYSN